MLIFIVIVIVIIALVVYLKKRNKSMPETTRKNTAVSNKTVRIEDCISNEDLQYQMSREMQRIINTIDSSRTAIKTVSAEANKEINTAWLNSYKKIITVSTNLDENLKYYSKKSLEQSRFQYYTSLHFRSMLAADITYKEFLKINENFEEINKLIVDIAKTGKKVNMSKEQIYSVKDSLKELRKVFLNRVHELNQQTATLRDKIGRDFGKRGEIWRAERMKNHR